MTKNNKTSNAKETVYDRCAYAGCYNGKFINGRRLFHFPLETDRRLEMWIERSGNFRLRTWAATSLRKAGLCGDHFDEKCFTNATRKALRRNVVPRHYTEDTKFREQNGKRTMANNDNHRDNKNDVVAEENKVDLPNCDEPVSIPGATTTVLQIQSRGTDDESSSWHSDEFTSAGANLRVARDSTPSPVVEFIVEELDETLICNDEASDPEERYSPFDDPNFDYVGIKMENGDSSANGTSLVALEETTELRVNRTKSDPRMYDHPTNHHRSEPQLKSCKSGTSTDGELLVPTEPITKPAAVMAGGNVEKVELMLVKLQCDKQNLRNTVKRLNQKLRRAEVWKTNFKNIRSKLKNVDEFLDVQECTNPVARAMVKLALHKQHVPYTKEEKDFATQLYRHSSTAFLSLRRAGCNFPGKSTMKRWIADDNGEPSACDFIETAEATDCDDDADEHYVIIQDIGESGENKMVEETVEQMDEISNGSGEIVEMPMDELVEHFEEVIQDTTEYDEYVEQLPPDENVEEDFK